MLKPALLTLCWLCAVQIAAQRPRTFSDAIRTLRLEVAGTDKRVPVLDRRKDERLLVSFDDMTHEYRRFTYSVEHCGWDWQPTDGLFESEYLAAANAEEPIEGYAQSMNTSALYTHYAFTLPNSSVTPLLSGNYRITIRTENEEGETEPVAEAFFSIVDQAVGITAAATTNTDIDWNATHQQLTMAVDWRSLRIHDARSQLKAVVLQNGRWDNACMAPAPTGATGTALLWEHQRALIFPAGNEYRKFEMLSTRYPGMGLESVRWYAPFYHAQLFPAAPRRNYLYDEDRNGRSVVRNDEGLSDSPDTGSDYLLTHFRLDADRMDGAEVYINGDWTHDRLDASYRMTYNDEAHAYEATLLLKEGYYSYQYLTTTAAAPSTGLTGPVEGDYFQTENEYDILIYYRDASERYDRLVGHHSFSYRPR